MPLILVVDDNQDGREMLAKKLRQHGFEAKTASGGSQAIEQTVSENPSLVIMDMNMPGTDGWAATREIRGLGHSMPIIALTGHTMDGDRERAIDVGCNAFQVKPIEWDELLVLIERLL